jgi:hypothetical protein
MERAPRTDPLSRSLDQALAGEKRPLFDLLTRSSGLPGRHVNEALALAFADECRARGASVDALVVSMATLGADSAPGATALEFIPVCGVAGVAVRAASDDKAFEAMLRTLHDCADDLRFRVREAVANGLCRIGERRGNTLVVELAGWMDGFFHAAAVLTALSQREWLARIPAPDDVLARFEEAFALARNATRAAARYPGHKALVVALSTAPVAAAARFGVPVFDALERWSSVKDPVLRDAIGTSIADPRLAGRFAPEVARVKKALSESAQKRRDPRTDVGRTRGRGRKGKSR